MMRIVTWNCQGAFRKKAEAVAQFKPDIAIIQECECPERLAFPPHLPQPTTQMWFGERATQGICVLSYNGLRFALGEAYDPAIRYCVPLRVSGPTADFHLLAVWAMPHTNPRLSYVGQIAQAITRYGDFLTEKETVVAGDFNSNKQWDRKPRIGNHSWVVDALARHGLVSVYHEWSGEAQGAESAKTLFMYRKRAKTYHIDYCFAPRPWLKRLRFFAVGEYERWSAASDHMPLFLEFSG
ncbi:MAG: exonuclease [Chloroflexi bacterium]|nr:MAG: exonuclease [Chloroflexota bacterium]